jgi:general secretion pathway protein I
MNRPPAQQGFTLLEMMIALAILSVSYIALMQTQGASIHLGTYGRQISVATFLAQSKIEEIEEDLYREGFPDMDKSEEGDFDEQGYPHFKFTVDINKIDLPIGQALTGMMSKMNGGEKDTGQRGLGGQGVNKNGRAAGMLNPNMLASQMNMMTEMLEQSLREVHCKVWWDQGGPGYEMEIVTHLVRVPQAAGGSSTRQPPPRGILGPGRTQPRPSTRGATM